MSTPIMNLLAADGPFPEDEDKLMLYGQFIGSWDIEAKWYNRSGVIRAGKGEWHFQWVLGGRGIQDVLFSKGAKSHQYGTTLRCYDSNSEIWHLTWMHPESGEYVNLLGKREGMNAVAVSVGAGPKMRWTFTNITKDAFHWLGEVSLQGGDEWLLEQEMYATRQGL